mmetsp:Transcript_34458/g.88392  ORF Transcript_34458/g.88392 Transcript_34458/m.88392 type:complete len:271 (+) Transcript_34458:84-896(+)
MRLPGKSKRTVALPSDRKVSAKPLSPTIAAPVATGVSSLALRATAASRCATAACRRAATASGPLCTVPACAPLMSVVCRLFMCSGRFPRGPHNWYRKAPTRICGFAPWTSRVSRLSCGSPLSRTNCLGTLPETLPISCATTAGGSRVPLVRSSSHRVWREVPPPGGRGTTYLGVSGSVLRGENFRAEDASASTAAMADVDGCGGACPAMACRTVSARFRKPFERNSCSQRKMSRGGLPGHGHAGFAAAPSTSETSIPSRPDHRYVSCGAC